MFMSGKKVMSKKELNAKPQIITPWISPVGAPSIVKLANDLSYCS